MGFGQRPGVFFKYDLNHWLNTDFWVENLSEFELSGPEPGNLHKSSNVLLIIMPFTPNLQCKRLKCRPPVFPTALHLSIQDTKGLRGP